MPALLIALGF